ncbi:MAG: saccharopine dehydrogenase family protein, partial [Methanobacteriota archaeon]
FVPEPPLDLSARAKKSGAAVVLDAGVAPGLSHLLAADLHRAAGGRLDALRIYVGGLPISPPPVFRHAVYFNARDLLDEYIRPARLRRGGRDEAPAPLLAPPEHVVDAEVGPLEAFPSDGLRTLLSSLPDGADMVELTLRVPGHLATMRDLAELGLLAGDSATDALAAALLRRYPSAEHPDRLLLEVQADRGGARSAYRLHVLHHGGASAMARATGFTAAAIAASVARDPPEAGVHPPEALGAEPDRVQGILSDLADRGLPVTRTTKLSRRPASGA